MTTTTIPSNSNANDTREEPVMEPNAVAENENNDESTPPPNNKNACYKKLAIILVLVGFIVFIIVDSLTNKYIRSGLLSFLEWFEENPVAGVFSFVLVYFVATVCFVPGTILTIGAGFVFAASSDSLWKGVALGTCAVFVGASLGAIAAFLLGRYLLRDGCVARLTQKYPVFGAIDAALEQKGLRIMVLMRLSPIVPFNVLNYLASVTAIRLFDYSIACFGMLPGTILYVFFGASAGSLTEIGGGETETDDDETTNNSNKTLTLVFIVVGVVFGIAALGLTTYYAKQELNKVLNKEDDDDDGSENKDENNNGDVENPQAIGETTGSATPVAAE